MKVKHRRPNKTWLLRRTDPTLSAQIAESLSLSPLLSSLLVARGIGDAEEAASFLQPKLSHLADPEGLPGIQEAVGRVVRAIQEKESIVVFGDYDVDGISSTVLLMEFFAFLDVPAGHYIPQRLSEGYGLNSGAVRRLAAEGCRLIITVDNGSTAVEAVDTARSLGVDVVIIDHHLSGERLPAAVAIVNPWLPGSRYAFPYLAGVGVTFKFVWAMCQHFSRARKVSPEFRDFMTESLALVALGTIADVVPLRGENRVFARFGLRGLETSRRPGLQALVRLALRGEPERALTSEDIAFRVAPCLNAAGRLGDANSAVRLLLTRDAAEADELVRTLVSENRRRREIEKTILAEVRECLNGNHDPAREKVLVVAREGWHPGVIGIVASRVVDEYCRPTLLISLDGAEGKGSARSIPQVSICDALDKASDCLESYGGHAMAAGVTVASDRVEALRDALNCAVDLSPEEMLPQIEIDGSCGLGEWTPRTLRELERLAPFGEGNPEPRFSLRAAEVVGVPRLLGNDSSHLSFFVRDRDRSLRAVAFGKGAYHRELVSTGRVSLVYQPFLNRWRGEQNVELRVHELLVE